MLIEVNFPEDEGVKMRLSLNGRDKIIVTLINKYAEVPEIIDYVVNVDELRTAIRKLVAK